MPPAKSARQGAWAKMVWLPSRRAVLHAAFVSQRHGDNSPQKRGQWLLAIYTSKAADRSVRATLGALPPELLGSRCQHPPRRRGRFTMQARTGRLPRRVALEARQDQQANVNHIILARAVGIFRHWGIRVYIRCVHSLVSRIDLNAPGSIDKRTVRRTSTPNPRSASTNLPSRYPQPCGGQRSNSVR